MMAYSADTLKQTTVLNLVAQGSRWRDLDVGTAPQPTRLKYLLHYWQRNLRHRLEH